MSKLSKFFKNPYAFFRDVKRKRDKLSTRRLPIQTFMLGAPLWKQHLSSWFPERRFVFLSENLTAEKFDVKFKVRMLRDPNAEVFIWGIDVEPFIMRFIVQHHMRCTYVHDGFIRSASLPAENCAPYSLIMDSRSPYYDSSNASDLETLLNEYDFAADEVLLERADMLMATMLEMGLSKYNHVARVDNIELVYGPKEKRRILVLGQVENSESMRRGSPLPYTNNDAVIIAAKENPDAQIIYKPHPGVIDRWHSQISNPLDVQNLCLIVDQDIPIAQALETIDHVYTVNSLAGFEALMRGVGVTALGCPFYSGWGLTDDRQPNSRRGRRLSLRELFAAAYILYPEYFDPVYGTKITPEEALERLYKEREFSLALTAKASALQDGRPYAFMFGFNPWKRDFIEKAFPEYKMHFVPGKAGISKSLRGVIEACSKKVFIIWSYKEHVSVSEYARQHGIKIRRMEDGFVRSISLGATHSIPYSLCLDNDGLYFDATKPNLLEEILNTYNFQKDVSLMAEARECIKLLLEQNVSKYNMAEGKDIEEIYGPKKGKRILVVGQVEDDASIQYGCSRLVTNNDLVLLARFENPDAEIIYKPHPDVLQGHRQKLSDPEAAEPFAKVIYEQLSLPDSLKTIDHVYTVTSLSGFEALLRGIKVTTFGCPFYSGWGLTDDRQPNERRKRKITVEEVFAGAYLLYPFYFDPVTKERTTARKVINDIGFIRSAWDKHLREKAALEDAMKNENEVSDTLSTAGVLAIGDQGSTAMSLPLTIHLDDGVAVAGNRDRKIRIDFMLNLTARVTGDSKPS
ncbi:MAG: hypothetical protein AB9866_16715 [Syntrophobacteraceae bacterium]